MRWSVRSAQMTMLLAVLLGTAALIGGTAYYTMRFAIQDLGDRVVVQGFGRVEQFVETTLAVAHAQGETDAALLAQAVIAPDDHERMTRYFHGAIAARPSLSYISFATEDDRYWHVYRDATGQITGQWFLPNANGGRDLTDFRFGPDGTFVPVANICDSDRPLPTGRPYYVAAKQAGVPTWPETYVFVGAGGAADVPGVTRATPIRGPDGTLQGVATADFDVLALCKVLREVDLGERGLIFILERRRDGTLRVIAHPDMPDQIEITRPAAGGGRELLPASEVEDGRVRAVLDALPAPGTPDPASMVSSMVDVGEERWIAAWRPLPGVDRPDWLIAAMVPESQLLGRVQAMRRKTILIALAGVLVVLVLSLLVSARVSRRLESIVDETQRIADFELEPREPLRSSIREIDRLGTAQEEMKAGLRSFQKYVPSELVRAILASGKEAELGGERRRITVLFSDVAGFTSVAESLSPETLVELLAEYLGAMTRSMLERGATVDKYIGDAIMSFWGAPHDVADQAWLACSTALSNQRALARLRERWLQAGQPAIRARIGLHTGEAIVGNFGSENRLDYTAIGDTVNLGSRLESLNKQYGTWILMSEVTQAEVADRVVSRRIDRVKVVGRDAGVWVHELVGLPEDVDDATRARLAAYERALDLYMARDFAGAVAAFEALLVEHGDDAPTHVMLARAHAYAQAPPPDGWDGVHTSTTK